MDVSCPHCDLAIALVDEKSREEIVCPACGSSFRATPGTTTTTWAPHAGQRRLGRFELIDHIGMGAFGTVYKARDPELDRIVAIKVPRAAELATQDDIDRFLREARSVAQLRHPGIVPVFEVGKTDELPFLVSEFVDGVTLADRATARRLNYGEAARMIEAIARALEYAHSHGVIHRDVKPANVILGDDGQPRLMDFGLAKRDEGEVTMTADGQVIGTPAYMSPEQAAGLSHEVDGRSDVYSLGVILYWLLTGKLPFQGNSRMLIYQVQRDEPPAPRKHDRRIPRDLETICLKAMAKSPDRRYFTAHGLAEDLRRYLNGEPIHARRVTPVGRLWRWCRRKPAVAGLSATLVLAIASSMLLLAVASRPAAPMSVFLNTKQEPEARIAALDALEVSDPLVFPRVLSSISIESDLRVLQRVLQKTTQYLRVDGYATPQQRNAYVAALSDLLGRRNTGPAKQRAALTALTDVATPDEAFGVMQTSLRDDTVPEVLDQMLAYTQRQADSLSQDVAQQDAGHAAAIIAFAKSVIERPLDSEHRLAAFDVCAAQTSAPHTLQTIASVLPKTHDGVFIRRMTDFVRELDLPGLTPQQRAETVRLMTQWIRTDNPTILAQVGAAQFDRQAPDVLCEWLITAFEDSDEKLAARESLVPYVSRTQRENRADEIGEYIQTQLHDLAKVAPREKIRYSFRLEFLVQAIGELQGYCDQEFSQALSDVAYMLNHPDELEDPYVLDTVINAFAQLNLDQSLPPDRVRAMVVDPRFSNHVRATAATVLGRPLRDVDSIEALAQVLINDKSETGILNVRVAAARALGELGHQFKRGGESTDVIKHVLLDVIDDENRTGNPSDVVEAAIQAMIPIAGADDAKALFPWTHDPAVYFTAILGINSMIMHAPDEAEVIVRDFLQWRPAAGPPPPDLLEAPEGSLIGFELQRDASEQQKTAAAKAVVEALAASVEDPRLDVRRGANDLLNQILALTDAPRLDPEADNLAGRAAQVALWKTWWRRVEPRLRLKGQTLRLD